VLTQGWSGHCLDPACSLLPATTKQGVKGEFVLCFFLPVTKLKCTFHPAACHDCAVIIKHFINNNVTFSDWVSD
jgi:hypothetical protein